MSTQTERFFSRKSSPRSGQGIRLNQTNLTDMSETPLEDAAEPTGRPGWPAWRRAGPRRPSAGDGAEPVGVRWPAVNAGSSPTADLDRFEALVRARRTNLRIDADRPVPDELVERLCRLATWAPNHKRTWPWRFVAVSGPARARLGVALAEQLALEGAPEGKVAKARVKYERAPLMLAVASTGDDDPVVAAENRDAVAAGVQNLLLGATAAGLASYWGTGAVTEVPAVRELCGLRLGRAPGGAGLPGLAGR